MTNIAIHPHYTIYVCTEENRVFLTLMGFWGSTESVPLYLQHCQKALQQVSPGFTMLSNLRELQLHPRSVCEDLHHTVCQWCIDARIGKVAMVVPESLIATYQVEQVCKAKGLPQQTFYEEEPALEWLKQISLEPPLLDKMA